jgi:hypothetical protein
MVSSIVKVFLQIIAFVVIYVDVSSASSLRCEVVEYQGMVNPELPDSIYWSTHISATVSSPQSFKFEGPSNVGLTISRAVAQSPGYVRIEVDAMDIASGETENCSLDKVELKSISGFYMSTIFGPPTKPNREPSTIALIKFSTPDKTPKRWSIRLYDPSNGGTLEDGPYALQATINVNLRSNTYETSPMIFPKVDIDPKLPWSSLDPKDSGSFSLQECQSVPGPIRQGVTLKLVDQILLSDIPPDNSSLVFAVASGRRLYARLVGSDLNTRPSIRLYTGSFLNPACSQTILSNTDYVVAQQPWENLYPTWRVELEGGAHQLVTSSFIVKMHPNLISPGLKSIDLNY